MTDTVDTLKQRIVGAFVIISLAVIFLPMIFDEPHEAKSNVIVSVPPRPALKVIEIEKPKMPEFSQLESDPNTLKIIEKEPQLQAINEPDQITEQDNISQKTESAVQLSKSEPELVSKTSRRPTSTPSVDHLPVFKSVWMVQLGTFSNTDNAYQLRDNLRKDGFDGHTKKVDIKGKPAIRVFTGPFVDKTEAEKIKRQLDKKYKLVSRVMFFDA